VPLRLHDRRLRLARQVLEGGRVEERLVEPPSVFRAYLGQWGVGDDTGRLSSGVAI
jgi:hypothetical protein